MLSQGVRPNKVGKCANSETFDHYCYHNDNEIDKSQGPI